MPGPVIYLVRSWPRLSQTFIVNEVLALERLGVELVLFSLSDRGERWSSHRSARCGPRVHYLDERRSAAAAARRARAVFSRCARCATRGTAVFAGRRRDLAPATPPPAPGNASPTPCRWPRPSSGSAGRHGARAPARPLRSRPGAGRAAGPARLTGLPYSFTAHARDLYQIPPASLAARAAAATALVTCCAANADYLAATCRRGLPGVRLIHHGVELDRFRPAPAVAGAARRRRAIVSVGRLVEKKGFPDLLRGLRPRCGPTGRRFRCGCTATGRCGRR